MQVAAIQMVSTATLKDNLEQAQHLLRQASAQGAELAVLPEYFCLMGQKDADKLAVQEPFCPSPLQSAQTALHPIQHFLARAASDLGLWIVAGTLPLSGATAGEGPGRVYNSALTYNPQGVCVARYDKMHLFRFDNGVESYDESRVLHQGAQPTRFALPSTDGHVWQVGMGVCYDLRFPELFRGYASQGLDLIVLPAAFTHTTGQAHWEILLRARAIENLCSVVAAAQGGLHPNGRRTWGQSMVIDAWGQILASQASEAGVVLAEVDAASLHSRRMQLPALQHRLL